MITQPINLLFRFLQNHALVSIRLQSDFSVKIQGMLIGFDEFMNVVLENALLIDFSSEKSEIGHVLIKGDCIVTISEIS